MIVGSEDGVCSFNIAICHAEEACSCILVVAIPDARFLDSDPDPLRVYPNALEMLLGLLAGALVSQLPA